MQDTFCEEYTIISQGKLQDLSKDRTVVCSGHIEWHVVNLRIMVVQLLLR